MERRAVALLVEPLTDQGKRHRRAATADSFAICGDQAVSLAVLDGLSALAAWDADYKKAGGFIRGRLWHRRTPDRAELPAANRNTRTDTDIGSNLASSVKVSATGRGALSGSPSSLDSPLNPAIGRKFSASRKVPAACSAFGKIWPTMSNRRVPS